MFHRSLFISAHQVGDISFYPTYKSLIKYQFNSYELLIENQLRQLKSMISFAYKCIPYYNRLFKKLNLMPEDIKKIEDLEKLPILTKDIIMNNWEDFTPINLRKMKFYHYTTSGSTGTPFKYRLSKFDRFLSGAMCYRGWSYGGYELGDKMVFLAGSSLGVGIKSNVITKANEFVRNTKMLSSYDMDQNNMKKYVSTINSLEPNFINGYASSVYFLANYIKDNDLKIHPPSAIFVTAEKLFPIMRETIQEAFGCEVFDGYGLNDGGVSAYECEEHNGLHINTERSLMEIVDDDGIQVIEGEGRILATSLYNYAMPFIRYDTGDTGYITDDYCNCGRNYKLLKEVMGRQQEILKTPEGKYVHGGFFSHLFWEIEGVKEFQIIQKKLDNIIINIVIEESFDEKQLNLIKEIIRTKSKEWNIEFQYVDKIDRTKNGKYKYVISELVNP